MLKANLSVYASTPRARVEVRHMPSRVATEAEGRIAEVHLELGEYVQRGALLLRLDSSIQEAQLRQLRVQLTVVAARREGLEDQLVAEQQQRRSRLRLGVLNTERAAIGLEQAQQSIRHQQLLSNIAEGLWREQINSKIDTVNAEGDLLKRRFAVADAKSEIRQIQAELEYQDKSELTRIAALNRELVELNAERLSGEAAIATAQVQLQLLRVTAPVSGRVGRLQSLQAGDVVKAGQILATLVPSAEVRIVAQFPPEQAVGVVLPGQAARVRLDGFSWVEFGSLPATVRHTASEPDQGLIRVELTLDDPNSSARTNLSPIPLQHGLTASVDIQTGHLSPWALVQRSVGAGFSRSIHSNPARGAQRIAQEGGP